MSERRAIVSTAAGSASGNLSLYSVSAAGLAPPLSSDTVFSLSTQPQPLEPETADVRAGHSVAAQVAAGTAVPLPSSTVGASAPPRQQSFIGSVAVAVAASPAVFTLPTASAAETVRRAAAAAAATFSSPSSPALARAAGGVVSSPARSPRLSGALSVGFETAMEPAAVRLEGGRVAVAYSDSLPGPRARTPDGASAVPATKDVGEGDVPALMASGRPNSPRRSQLILAGPRSPTRSGVSGGSSSYLGGRSSTPSSSGGSMGLGERLVSSRIDEAPATLSTTPACVAARDGTASMPLVPFRLSSLGPTPTPTQVVATTKSPSSQHRQLRGFGHLPPSLLSPVSAASLTTSSSLIPSSEGSSSTGSVAAHPFLHERVSAADSAGSGGAPELHPYLHDRNHSSGSGGSGGAAGTRSDSHSRVGSDGGGAGSGGISTGPTEFDDPAPLPLRHQRHQHGHQQQRPQQQHQQQPSTAAAVVSALGARVTAATPDHIVDDDVGVGAGATRGRPATGGGGVAADSSSGSDSAGYHHRQQSVAASAFELDSAAAPPASLGLRRGVHSPSDAPLSRDNAARMDGGVSDCIPDSAALVAWARTGSAAVAPVRIAAASAAVPASPLMVTVVSPRLVTGLTPSPRPLIAPPLARLASSSQSDIRIAAHSPASPATSSPTIASAHSAGSPSDLRVTPNSFLALSKPLHFANAAAPLSLAPTLPAVQPNPQQQSYPQGMPRKPAAPAPASRGVSAGADGPPSSSPRHVHNLPSSITSDASSSTSILTSSSSSSAISSYPVSPSAALVLTSTYPSTASSLESSLVTGGHLRASSSKWISGLSSSTAVLSATPSAPSFSTFLPSASAVSSSAPPQSSFEYTATSSLPPAAAAAAAATTKTAQVPPPPLSNSLGAAAVASAATAAALSARATTAETRAAAAEAEAARLSALVESMRRDVAAAEAGAASLLSDLHAERVRAAAEAEAVRMDAEARAAAASSQQAAAYEARLADTADQVAAMEADLVHARMSLEHARVEGSLAEDAAAASSATAGSLAGQLVAISAILTGAHRQLQPHRHHRHHHRRHHHMGEGVSVSPSSQYASQYSDGGSAFPASTLSDSEDRGGEGVSAPHLFCPGEEDDLPGRLRAILDVLLRRQSEAVAHADAYAAQLAAMAPSGDLQRTVVDALTQVSDELCF